MSAGTSGAFERTSQRGFPRYPVKVPLDVIALNSGIPQNLPGRCVDLSEGGVGAMVAGELSPGQHVGVELRLPNVGPPLRARALVRYQGKVRCGFEFVGLSDEEREMIRYWSQRLATETRKLESDGTKLESDRTGSEPANVGRRATARLKIPRIQFHRQRLRLLLTALLVLAVSVWWQWQRSWKELESARTTEQAPLRVSPETMSARIISKVDPEYPDEARSAGLQGLVVLDAVIAADGTVKHLDRVSGDEVLVKSAEDAVRQWRFEPYKSFGRAREVETSIIVEFRLK